MSWVSYPADHPFPIQNLPYGVFKPRPDAPARPGVAIGDYVLDLRVLAEHGLFPEPVATALKEPTLNAFMGLGRSHWQATRATLQRLLARDAGGELRDNTQLREEALVQQNQVQMQLPAHIGDYTDFYSSEEHASNVGRLFRPGQPPLLPNWKYIPVAYHGRASSINISGVPVRRPLGQTRPNEEAPPVFGPCKGLDFELEVAVFVGPGNKQGEIIPVAEAEDHIFGIVLFNDWSARDIQKWEYVPLGPFLSKSFASTISPWIVTLDALQPFRVPTKPQDPEPFPYLKEPTEKGTWDIHLSVGLQTEKMAEPQVISTANFRHLYWSVRQQLAHHTINGCNLNPGDVLASGTISGPTRDSCGSLLEITKRASEPVELSSGEKRGFIADGDTISINGWCQGDGFRIGFGPCAAKVLPALTL